MKLSEEKEPDEKLGDNTYLGEYIARAMGTFVERLEFEVCNRLMLKVQNVFYSPAKPKRRWYGPFQVHRICKGNYIEIWDNTLGSIR